MIQERINRRQFIKMLSKMAFVGLGAAVGGGLLAACTRGSNIEKLLDQTSERNKDFLAFSNKSLGYYFYIIQQEATNRAAQARGWNFQALVADFDPVKQSKQVEQLADKKPLAIVADPIDSEGFVHALEYARKQHIPFGIIDTPVTNGRAAFTISFDNYKGGEMAARIIVDLLQKKYGKPKGTVLNCYGQLSSYAWRLRKEGFENVLRGYPGIRVISVPTEGDMMKMYEATTQTLDEYSLDAVHAPSETPARGIYEALKNKGKLHPAGSEEHVIFVTIDGEPIALNWIKDGFLDASISQDPIAYGEICVEMLEKYLQTGEVPLGKYFNSKYYWKEAEIVETPSGPAMILPPFSIDIHNVEDKRHWGNIAYHDWGIKYQ